MTGKIAKKQRKLFQKSSRIPWKNGGKSTKNGQNDGKSSKNGQKNVQKNGERKS